MYICGVCGLAFCLAPTQISLPMSRPLRLEFDGALVPGAVQGGAGSRITKHRYPLQKVRPQAWPFFYCRTVHIRMFATDPTASPWRSRSLCGRQ